MIYLIMFFYMDEFHHKEKIPLLRFTNNTFSEQKFIESLFTVLQWNHIRNATMADFPHKMNCVTAMRYIIANTMNITLPTDRIGNLPKHIVQEWLWTIREDIPQQWDLIFLKRKILSEKYQITHMGIIDPDGNIINSTNRTDKYIDLAGIQEIYTLVNTEVMKTFLDYKELRQ